MTGFPKWGRLVEGQFGENGETLHENYKINIFGEKQRGSMGGQVNFSGSGGDHPSSPHYGEF